MIHAGQDGGAPAEGTQPAAEVCAAAPAGAGYGSGGASAALVMGVGPATPPAPSPRRRKPAFVRNASHTSRPLTLADYHTAPVKTDCEKALFWGLYPMYISGTRVDWAGLLQAYNLDVVLLWSYTGGRTVAALKTEQHLKYYAKNELLSRRDEFSNRLTAAAQVVEAATGNVVGAPHCVSQPQGVPAAPSMPAACPPAWGAHLAQQPASGAGPSSAAYAPPAGQPHGRGGGGRGGGRGGGGRGGDGKKACPRCRYHDVMVPWSKPHSKQCPYPTPRSSCSML